MDAPAVATGAGSVSGDEVVDDEQLPTSSPTTVTNRNFLIG